MNFCICASGHLGYVCLKNLIDDKIGIVAVCTDKYSRQIIELASETKIPCYIGNPRNGKALAFIENREIVIDVILSINYLFLLDKAFIDKVEKIAINFHGSLLPKYRGRTPHVWAIINNEKETGITAHVINENCDSGDILKQIIIPIGSEDTGADILKKYSIEYLSLMKVIINDINSDSLIYTPQDNTIATYFDKRTPEDGLINWNWQKERLHNWIRAQAKPYPGAFSFANNEKITIHKIGYSQLGYDNKHPNGLILKIANTPFVKTPNGVIELIDYEIENRKLLQEGSMLGKNETI